MAQRKQLAWSELRVGIFVLCAIAVVVGGVFYITGGQPFAARYRLVTHLPEVAGLNVGAPVTVDGVEVGNVTSIQMAQPQPDQPVDPSRSVRVDMQVNRDYQEYIRSDSMASLLTEGFLGNRSVIIQRGFTGRVLEEGETMPGVEEKAIQQVVERSADVLLNLNTLTTQISAIMETIQTGRGTIGKLLVDETIYDRLNDSLTRVDQMTAAIQGGEGTIGKFIQSDAFYAKAESAVSRVDNILGAVEQQRGALGKFIFDPSVHDDAMQFLGNTNALLADVREGRGTLGKLATDDTLFAAWHQAGTNLQAATAKLNDTGTTAGKIFSDPQLYDNLSGLTGDLRLLLGEFRQNPKRFLQVKISLF